MIRISSAEIQEHETRHAQSVRSLGAECTLFLKRNGDFPIQPTSVNLYGSGARRTVKGGKGSGDVNVRHSVSIEEGLTAAKFTVTTQEWLTAYDALAEQSAIDYWHALEEEAAAHNTSPYYLVMDHPRPPVRYELALDGNGEVNIYVIARDSSEGMDRQNIKGDIELLDEEVRDIRNLSARKEKFLLVLNVGGYIDLSPIMNCTENILLLGQLGSETGNIFADILTGKSMPSGKLSASWAKSLADYPSSGCFGMKTEIEYREGIYVGYRYFDTFDIPVRFPFGFGLGYTDFSLTPLSFTANGNAVTVSVRVRNIGNHCGKETVQAYVSYSAGENVPHKQLIGFAKSENIEPGEERTVNVAFDMLSAASYDTERHAYVLGRGTYRIHIGNSIANAVCACSLKVPEDVVTQVSHKLTAASIEELQARKSPIEEKPLLGEKTIFITESKPIKQTPYISNAVKKMSDESLVKLCVGVLNDMTLQNNIGASGKLVAGSAGETYSDENIAPLVLADGPAGLRISTKYKLDENGRVCEHANPLGGILPGGIGKDSVTPNENTFYQYCTAIPVGTALAQSFNPELCETMGDIVGAEMELFGVDIWLAPALNIQRNPLCGRNFEYYSEDPLLSGKIAAAVTRGVQSHKGRYVTIKHYCANNQERDRFFSDSRMSERALREIYLRGFEICIRESAPGALMTSYNLVNGVHTANSKELLCDVLRDEWGYEGLVMTDWMSTGGMGTGEKHGPSTASGCLAASNDLIMPGREEDARDILSAVKDGRVTRKNLEESASRILRLAEQKANSK